MLTSLRIRNLALVADLTLELDSGFNAITGETGAGKSILLGALNLLLGQRADRTLLRAGSDSCTVEGVLDLRRLRAPLAGFLEETGLEPCEGGQLFLRRSFTAAGANRQFVNGSPASLQTLSRLGEWLIDIHGPHDHQSLFQPARQLELLDAHAGLAAQRDVVSALHDRRAALAAAREALVIDERTYAQQLDLLRHQVREIETARLQPEESEQLEADYQRAQNAARILELTQAALDLLAEADDSLLARTGQLGRSLQELTRFDPATAQFQLIHVQIVEALRDLQARLSHYAEHIDLEPARLEQLGQRLDLIQSLRRKYGASIADVLAFGEEARRRLGVLESREADLARLEAERGIVESEFHAAATALSAARRDAIPRLTRAVVAQLRDLGFRQGAFDIALLTGEVAHRYGNDSVEFQFAPNPGEPARPLRGIASSGELARTMLALKTVLAAQDDIPVLVFDEVDANIGGETAHAVGAKMRELGRHHQVLCITHLAPVAAAANAHLVVNKVFRNGRTLTEIEPLEGAARIAELARMLGGGLPAQRHAEALLASETK